MNYSTDIDANQPVFFFYPKQLLLSLRHAFSVCILLIETVGHCLFVCSLAMLWLRKWFQCFNRGQCGAFDSWSIQSTMVYNKQRDQKWIRLGICRTPAVLKFVDHFYCQWKNYIQMKKWMDGWLVLFLCLVIYMKLSSWDYSETFLNNKPNILICIMAG